MHQHELPLSVPNPKTPRPDPALGQGIRIWNTVPARSYSGRADVRVSDGVLLGIVRKGQMPPESMIELGAFSARSRASKYDRWVLDCLLFNGYKPKPPAIRVFPMDSNHRWELLIYCETLSTNQVRALKSKFPAGN